MSWLDALDDKGRLLFLEELIILIEDWRATAEVGTELSRYYWQMATRLNM